MCENLSVETSIVSACLQRSGIPERIEKECVLPRKEYAKRLVAASAVLCVALVGGCRDSAGVTQSGEDARTSPPKIVLVREIGEGTEGSFNALAEEGLRDAEDDFDVEVRVMASSRPEQYADNLKNGVKSGGDMLFTVGEWMMVPTTRTAAENPDAIFAGIDQPYRTPGSNTVGLIFKEHEAAYLAGVVAGLSTLDLDLDRRINRKNVVGFIGGARVPLVERYEAGFTAGVMSVNPTATVLSAYTNSFEDEERGADICRTEIRRGADVILIAAGQSGLAVLDVAKDEGCLLIGVETDQSVTIPGASDVLLTSAMMRVDVVVYEAVERFLSGSLETGRNLEFGIAEDGVGLAPFHAFDDTISRSTIQAVRRAQGDIASGTVVVPETMPELE